MFNTQFELLSTDQLRFARPDLVQLLIRINDYCGNKLWIHRLYDPANINSKHYEGLAADGHIDGLSVVDQYVLLERFNPGGIGLYGPDVWRHPGFHFDIRNQLPTAKWGCIFEAGERKYVALDRNFFRRILQLEEG